MNANGVTRDFPFFSNPETVGMEKICGVIDKIYDCNEGFKSTIMKMGKGALKIITYFGVYVLFKNYEKIWNPIKLFILKIVYTRYIVKKEMENAIITRFKNMLPPKKDEKEEIKNEIWFSGLPVYLEKEGPETVIYHFSYLHSSILKDLCDMEESISPVENAICKDENGKTFTPLHMFPSENYTRVDDIIKTYFEIYEDTKMITPPILLINSPAGYGKTNVMHYLGRNGDVIKEIRLIDLCAPTMVNKSFSSIVSALVEREIHHPVVYAFDELDKYASMYTQHMFTSSQKGIKKDSSINIGEVVDDNYDVFEKQVKLGIITTMGRLDSVKNFHKGVVWLFFANNIHTIFRGLDQTHISSIKTRFTFIEFKKCDREEVMRYLTVYNDKLKNPKRKLDAFRLNCALRKLKLDTSVTFREIQISMNNTAWDIEKTVEYLNKGIFNPLLDYNGEDDIVPVYSSSRSVSLSPSDSSMGIVAQLEDSKMELEYSRKKKVDKENIVKDMITLIYHDDESGKECICELPTEELIVKLNDMACGYNLVKLSEIVIRTYDWYANLMYSCALYRPDILKYLLERGANPNIYIGKVCLLRNCPRGKEDSIILLLKYGANHDNYKHVAHALINNKEILKYVIYEKDLNINSDYFIDLVKPHRCSIFENLRYGGSEIEIITTIAIQFIDSLIEFGIEKKWLDDIMLFGFFSSKVSPKLIHYLLDRNMPVDRYYHFDQNVISPSPIIRILQYNTTEMNVEQKREIILRMIEKGGLHIPFFKNTILTKEQICSRYVDGDKFLDLFPDEMFSS